MKKLNGIILILFIMFFGIIDVSAFSKTYVHEIRFSRGVKNTCYYIDSSASAYTWMINTAAQQWASMPNNIVNTPVSSNYATHIDIYSSSPSLDTDLNNTVLAYTTLWSATGEQMAPWSYDNYFYTEIVINNSHSEVDSSTLAHEFGHAYGLDEHSYDRYSIMYPVKNYMMVTTPQETDNETINYLYP